MTLEVEKSSTAYVASHEDVTVLETNGVRARKGQEMHFSRSNSRQFVVAFTVNLLYISCKLATTSRHRMLQHLSKIENWPWQRHDLIHQTYCASALVSFPLFALLVQLNNRKLCIYTISFMYLLYPLLAVRTTCYEAFHFTQLFVAFIAAGTNIVTLVYISEISDRNVRATLLIMSALMSNVCPNVERLYPCVSHSFLSVLGMVPALIVIVCFLRYFPDTPVYLLRQGKTEAALGSLEWLQCSSNEEEIRRDAENVKAALNSAHSDPKKKIRMLQYSSVVIVMCITEHMTGFWATATELEQTLLRFCPNGRSYINFLLYICPVLGNITAITICERVKRRKNLLISTMTCSIMLLGIGICYQIIEDEISLKEVERFSPENLFVVIHSLVSMLSYNVGIGVLTPVVAADIFPVSELNTQFAVIGAISWLFTTLIDAIIYQEMKASIYINGAFTVYSIICAICALLIFRCLLEMRTPAMKILSTDNEKSELS